MFGLGQTIFNEVFHHSRWKLEWKNNTFDLLRIKFSINLTEMIDLNYKPIFQKIQNPLKQSKCRKLTPFGRLVVLKNLIIPKLNHLILTLPNPNNEMLKEKDKELCYFLWGGKVHKIKKKYCHSRL